MRYATTFFLYPHDFKLASFLSPGPARMGTDTRNAERVWVAQFMGRRIFRPASTPRRRNELSCRAGARSSPITRCGRCRTQCMDKRLDDRPGTAATTRPPRAGRSSTCRRAAARPTSRSRARRKMHVVLPYFRARKVGGDLCSVMYVEDVIMPDCGQWIKEEQPRRDDKNCRRLPHSPFVEVAMRYAVMMTTDEAETTAMKIRITSK